MYCGSYGATGGMGGMGMGGNSEFGSHGNSGIGGGYGSSVGNSGSAPSSGATGGMGGNSEFGSNGNSGIGGGSGSSSGAGSAPLRPIAFDFNEVTQTQTLPTGDKIRMDKSCNVAGLSPNSIRIVMRGTGGDRARGISFCPLPYQNLKSCRNVLRVQPNETKSKDIRALQLRVYMLAFDKVDAMNGLSTPEYEIKNKDDMKLGCSYMFTFS